MHNQLPMSHNSNFGIKYVMRQIFLNQKHLLSDYFRNGIIIIVEWI